MKYSWVLLKSQKHTTVMLLTDMITANNTLITIPQILEQDKQLLHIITCQ